MVAPLLLPGSCRCGFKEKVMSVIGGRGEVPAPLRGLGDAYQEPGELAGYGR